MPREEIPKRIREGYVITFGESGVGKTCFNDMLVMGAHFIGYNPTRPYAYQKSLQVNAVPWSLTFKDLSSTIFREDNNFNADIFNQWIRECMYGAVLLYDITSKASFEHVTTDGYLHMILHRKKQTKHFEDQVVYPSGSQRFGCVLVGNKKDLEEKRQVDEERAREWAESQGIEFFEVDTSKMEPLEEVIVALIKSIVRAEKRDAEDVEMQRKEQERRREEIKKQVSPRAKLGDAMRQVFRKSSS